MSTIGGVILLVLGVPALGLLVWVAVSASLVRVPSAAMGLVLVHGRASDTVLLPGVHLVPALRRRMLELYPAVELAYRPGVPGAVSGDLEQTGPALELFLGDRTAVRVGWTVRFRLRPAQLRDVHERFGPEGLFGAVRDQTASRLTRSLGQESVSVDELFGTGLEQLGTTCADELAAVLGPLGFEVTFFSFGPVDLGRTGELVQQVARARHELAAEQAEAALRRERAANDAQLQSLATADEAVRRYREADVWRELALRSGGLQLALRVADPAPAAALRTFTVPGPDPAEGSTP